MCNLIKMHLNVCNEKNVCLQSAVDEKQLPSTESMIETELCQNMLYKNSARSSPLLVSEVK